MKDHEQPDLFEPLGSALYRAMHQIAAARRSIRLAATKLPLVTNTQATKDAEYANANTRITDQPRGGEWD